MILVLRLVLTLIVLYSLSHKKERKPVFELQWLIKVCLGKWTPEAYNINIQLLVTTTHKIINSFWFLFKGIKNECRFLLNVKKNQIFTWIGSSQSHLVAVLDFKFRSWTARMNILLSWNGKRQTIKASIL